MANNAIAKSVTVTPAGPDTLRAPPCRWRGQCSRILFGDERRPGDKLLDALLRIDRKGTGA